jgi:hypothetical protein
MKMDYDDASDQGKSAPLKVTFPEALMADLAAYSEARGVSKSEILKQALINRLDYDPTWQRRTYFFKRRESKISAKELVDGLSKAPKGSLVKVAIGPVDNPTNANIYIGSLVKTSGKVAYVEFPYAFRATGLQESMNSDHLEVALSSGCLVVPVENSSSIAGVGWPQLQYIYAVDVSYIWDVDLSSPPPTTYYL